MKRPLLGVLLGLMALTAGCMTVGPDYAPPASEVPQQWQLQDDPALTPGETEIQKWWTVFNDPTLEDLIAKAAQGNRDLRSALARVEQARYQVGIIAGQEIPNLTGSGDLNQNRTSANDTGGVAATYWRYSAAVTASWEIDLFGRIRRSLESAQADYQAAEEDRIDVLISLYSQVAQAYLNLRSYQAQIKAARKNIESQKEVLDLTQVRFNNGLASGLDVAQAQAVLASSEAEVPPLLGALDRSRNQITLLLGLMPGALDKELAPTRPVPLVRPQVAVGIPADLLRRRPDIRAAERRIAAANALIGVATADLYPSFSLGGNLGLAALEPGDFFRSASQYYSWGPSVSWNIFKGGSIRSQIKYQDAAMREALNNYEQTLLSAVNETQSAFSAYVQQLAQVEALRRSVDAQRRTLEMAVQLYKEGLADFQSVLDAQRELFSLETQLAQAGGDAAVNLVLVYQALGGGWDPGPPAAPVETPLQRVKQIVHQ